MSVHAVGEAMLDSRSLAIPLACVTFGLAAKDGAPIEESTV